ncbi:hypothetical protein BGZ63DRAFT_435281 [Mariannaea sp. PMI_226]|nr:hypothetical protein BGZ63DRAFT_435281 [Mariannaea sp. PMI_226]
MSTDFPGPTNSAELVTVAIILPVIATILAVWRIGFRAQKKVLGLSDCCLVLGLCLALCQPGLILAPYFKWGYGHHRADLPPEIQNATMPKLLFWLDQVLFKAAAGFIKLSISAIYIGVFRNPVLLSIKIVRAANLVLMGVIIIYYFSATLVSTFQCRPIHKAWQAAVPGACIDNDQFRLANGYINVLTSIALISLPFPALLTMDHRSKEIWQFLFLIALGVIHTACAIWRVVLIHKPNPEAATDPQWANTTPYTLGIVELFVGIIAATIIVMRQCFHKLGKTVHESLTNSYSRTKLRSRSMPATIPNQGADANGEDRREIVVTSAIELESRSGSTEDLWVSEVGRIYHPGK